MLHTPKIIPIQPAKQENNPCASCVSKICCVVFDITLHEQGRHRGTIKYGGVRCEHLNNDGDCSIYESRWTHHGYAAACESYTCHKAGPLLDKWITDNEIDPIQDSTYIGNILRHFTWLIENTISEQERVLSFIESLLRDASSPKYLYDILCRTPIKQLWETYVNTSRI